MSLWKVIALLLRDSAVHKHRCEHDSTIFRHAKFRDSCNTAAINVTKQKYFLIHIRTIRPDNNLEQLILNENML